MSKSILKKHDLDRYPKKYTITDVFSWIDINLAKLDENERKIRKRVDMDGHLMKVYSQRYETFMSHGVKCCECGIEGDRFYKERSYKDSSVDGVGYHFNLYAIDSQGDDVLMTKDHIIAKSLGGKDDISNYQTMCYVCNQLKSNMTIEQWQNYKLSTEFISQHKK